MSMANDRTKYNFNDHALGKGRLVLEVIRYYSDENPSTASELKKIFPKELQAHGIDVILTDAEYRDRLAGSSDKTKRYFTDEQDIIHTSDGVEVYVTREWGAGNINRFIKKATKLGYSITHSQDDIPSIKELFDDYAESPRKDWADRYKARHKELMEFKGSAAGDISDEVLDVFWRTADNGVANPSPGVLSYKEYDLLKDDLRELTIKILNDSSQGCWDELGSWAETARSEGRFTSIKHGVINRVFATVSPELYCTILNGSKFKRFIKKINKAYGLSIDPEQSWPGLNRSLIEHVKSELGDTDTFLLNTFLWFMFSYFMDGDQLAFANRSRSGKTAGVSAMGEADLGEDSQQEQQGPINLILYGPPGTGKAYQLNSLIDQYTDNISTLSEEQFEAEVIEGLTWWDVICAALVDLGGRAKVPDIKSHRYIKAKAKHLSRTKNIGQTIWVQLQTHALSDSKTVKYTKRSSPLILDKTESSEWFLVDGWEEDSPGITDVLEALKYNPAVSTVIKRYSFVTFHQAFSYEDFVEGIRPVENEESGDMAYRVESGVFRSICTKAKNDPQHRYGIFIDEINRGNIAKILGELITLIEGDKRAVYNLEGELLDGMEVTLPYSGDSFGVPANLDIYATMNTADRSISLLDTALRRRFKFKELMPDASVISGSDETGMIPDDEGGEINLRRLLVVINQRMKFLLHRDQMIGHAYFTNVTTFAELKDVLINQIIPLLQEYFYEDWHRIQLVFRDVDGAGAKISPQIISHEKLSEVEVLGFDHDDYNDLVDYRVASPYEITPEAIRNIYEST